MHLNFNLALKLCSSLRIPFLLLLLTTHRTPALAIIHCWNHHHHFAPPSATDCAYIIAHLPSLQALHNNLLTNDSTNPPAPIRPSSPFPFIADIRHNTCAIDITAIQGGPAQLAIPFPPRNPPPPPTVAGTIAVWVAVRASLEGIVTHCVARGTSGEEFLHPGWANDRLEGVCYHVSVIPERDAARGTQKRQKLALMGDAEGMARWRSLPNRFGRTFYEV